jgi:L-ribulose-5-phosphate 4-epimerase
MDDLQELKEQVVIAREFLLQEKLISRYGHLSAFSPEQRLVLMTPNASEVHGRMQIDDVLTMRLDGEVVDGRVQPPIEWIIHTAIHRARPDALSVIHTHPVYSTSLTIAGVPIRPVYQHGAILGTEGVPVYDDPVIITTEDRAAQLVEVLGDAKVVELRGHGTVTVGRSVQEAFGVAFFLEDNSRKQLLATLVGQPKYMSEDEIARASFSVGDVSLKGLWDYYYDLYFRSRR